MRALALDFDGVLCDSAREAFAVAVRTYRRAISRELARGEADETLFAEFVALMPLGNRAEDYAIALAAIERGRALDDQAAYDAFRRELDPAALRAFHKQFYRERAAWIERDPVGWHALIRPYPGLCELLRRRAGDVSLWIATAKDRRSVRELLAHYGIDDLFPEHAVLDKETAVAKREHVRLIAERARVPVAEVTFVDDKVNHLEDVAAIGARCVLAAWGYNGARERRIAAERGFLVCELSDFEARVF
ncbi:MAG TPA: HAD family hydrolase [Myxococcota bacterium]|nr:HAD family hydrolase [Myxococcota bacterium]